MTKRILVFGLVFLAWIPGFLILINLISKDLDLYDTLMIWMMLSDTTGIPMIVFSFFWAMALALISFIIYYSVQIGLDAIRAKSGFVG